MIKFEGGTDFDLQVLDENYKEGEQKKAEAQNHDGPQQTEHANSEASAAEKTVAPISPSSVPLPETPAPPSALNKQEPPGEETKTHDSVNASTEPTKSTEDPAPDDAEEKWADGKVCICSDRLDMLRL